MSVAYEINVDAEQSVEGRVPKLLAVVCFEIVVLDSHLRSIGDDDDPVGWCELEAEPSRALDVQHPPLLLSVGGCLQERAFQHTELIKVGIDALYELHFMGRQLLAAARGCAAYDRVPGKWLLLRGARPGGRE